MRIALLGTRGVPAAYGGFETAVEEIGQRLARRGHEVVVYCRTEDRSRPTYLGMTLVHRPALRVKALETLSHTALSVRHLRRHPVDVAVVFNVANAPFVGAIQSLGRRVALHVDGMEWRRGKWGPAGRRYFHAAERLAVRRADRLIADSLAIQRYYSATYGVTPSYIPYGAEVVEHPGSDRLAALGVEAGAYHLLVARFEPENNVHLMLGAFSRSGATRPLVVVGAAAYGSSYRDTIAALAARDRRIRLVGAIYDQCVLNQLYGNAASYLHGHSVGGTNPSLLRAMAAAVPISAFDVEFNREVAGASARYFSSEPELAQLVQETEDDGPASATRGLAGRRRVASHYRWDDVTDSYEELCEELVVAPGAGSRQVTGRQVPKVASMAGMVAQVVTASPRLMRPSRTPRPPAW